MWTIDSLVGFESLEPSGDQRQVYLILYEEERERELQSTPMGGWFCRLQGGVPKLKFRVSAGRLSAQRICGFDFLEDSEEHSRVGLYFPSRGSGLMVTLRFIIGKVNHMCIQHYAPHLLYNIVPHVIGTIGRFGC